MCNVTRYFTYITFMASLTVSKMDLHFMCFDTFFFFVPEMLEAHVAHETAVDTLSATIVALFS